MGFTTIGVILAAAIAVSANGISSRLATTWSSDGTVTAAAVGVRQVDDHIWLVTFMHYDLGYFDDETCRLEPIDNPFGPKVLPMCSV